MVIGPNSALDRSSGQAFQEVVPAGDGGGAALLVARDNRCQDGCVQVGCQYEAASDRDVGVREAAGKAEDHAAEFRQQRVVLIAAEVTDAADALPIAVEDVIASIGCIASLSAC